MIKTLQKVGRGNMCYVTSVMFNSLQPYGLYPTKLLCPWDYPGKNTGVGCHALLQGIFLTQGLNLRLLYFPALAGRFFITSTTWEALILYMLLLLLLSHFSHVQLCATPSLGFSRQEHS